MQTGTKGGDIPSAGTMVIDTDGDYFDITGTTGITGMTVAAGRRFTLQFDGAVAITDNAAITLSGATSFTTAAGDILSFIAVAADTVVQTGYSLVDGGSPVASGGVPDATRPAFLVTADAQNNVSGGSTTYTVLWANEIFDQANNFASNAFTAPSTGRYLLSGNIRISGFDGNEDHCMMKIVTSNRTYTDMIAHTDLVSNSHRTFRLAVVADMDADDTATTTFFGAGSSGDILDIDGQTGTSPVESATYFSGCLIA